MNCCYSGIVQIISHKRTSVSAYFVLPAFKVVMEKFCLKRLNFLKAVFFLRFLDFYVCPSKTRHIWLWNK